MLGADLIKYIVDKDLVDKEILVVSNASDVDDVENEGSQIDSIQLIEDQGIGVLVIDGDIEQ